MTWTSNGSISERLRALKIQDDLLIKNVQNDPTMAASMQQPAMNVQPVQQMPLSPGQGDFSGIGVAINEARDMCDAVMSKIDSANAAISSQNSAGVKAEKLTAIGVMLSEIKTAIIANTKHELMIAHEQFNALTENDATQSMTEGGAARIESGTASPFLSPQGNASRMGVM
jgi:hypothetical protein